MAVALLLGGWLRLDQLAIQTLLDDEWHAVHQLVRSQPAGFLLSHGHDDHSIGLTAWAWLLAEAGGLSELGLRAPSLVAGLASVLLLPWALRGSLGCRVVVITALLLAISPLLIGYARMARPYACTLLLTLGGFALLDAATAGPRPRWWAIGAYALLAGLAVWLHAVTAPLVIAPVLALGWQCWRGRGLGGRQWLALAGLVGAAVALALLPPLVHDLAALTAKAGRDTPRWSTLQGVWHVWFGTSSLTLVVICLLLAAWGAGPVWRASRVVRWAALGLGLTLAAVLVARPAWIFNPLTFGRYLLPALPLLLLAVAAGLVRLTDAVLTRLRPSVTASGRALASVGPALLLGGAAFLTSPQPALLKVPNGHALHYYHQFDFRPTHNPVVSLFDAIPLSGFWATLAAQAPASVRVAVAPFRFESPAWLGSAWETRSRQRVLPGFLSGGCAPWLMGEVPPGPRFAFRNAVHLADDAALAARRIDYVAFDRRAIVIDAQGVKRKAPECEAWMRQRFGTPVFEDTDLVVWQLPGARR